MDLYKMGLLPPSSDGMALCQDGHVQNPTAERTATVMQDIATGLALAKDVFQIHGALMTGHMRFRKFVSNQPAAGVVKDACNTGPGNLHDLTIG